MGFDFENGDEHAHWSSDNLARVIDMMRRAGTGWEFDLVSIKEITSTLAEEMVEILLTVVRNKLEPDMLVRWMNYDGLSDLFDGEPGAEMQSNVFVIAFPWGGDPVMIYEDDPRWPGMFFQHLCDFVMFLALAVKAGQTITVT